MKNCNILFKKANLTFILMFVGLMFCSAQGNKQIGHVNVSYFQGDIENPLCLDEGAFDILIHGEASQFLPGINHNMELAIVIGDSEENEEIYSWTNTMFNYVQTSSWEIDFYTELVFDCDLDFTPADGFFIELSIGGNVHERIEIKLCCIERGLTEQSSQINFREQSDIKKFFVFNAIGQNVYESNSSLEILLGSELNALNSGLYYIIEKSYGSRKFVKQVFLP